MNAVAKIEPADGVEHYRQSTDAAGICRDIVLQTARKIGGRQYVQVEGWQAIALAHGCIAAAEDVRRVTDDGCEGFAAIGVVRRMLDGVELSRAEGFVGDDEAMWFKRPVYARRAMAQTRAISRACRSAFAHVVVLMNAGLSTTPAEEVPDEGFDDAPAPKRRARVEETSALPEPSAAVMVAERAIIMLQTTDDCARWYRENVAMLKASPQAERDAILAILKRQKEANAEAEARRAKREADDFREPGSGDVAGRRGDPTPVTADPFDDDIPF